MKSYIVHLFSGAPVGPKHEVQEIEEAEITAYFERVTCDGQPVLPIVQSLGIAETERFDIDDNLIVVHRLR